MRYISRDDKKKKIVFLNVTKFKIQIIISYSLVLLYCAKDRELFLHLKLLKNFVARFENNNFAIF